MAITLLRLKDACVRFSGTPVFEGLTAQILEGDRICLVGRNGCGKSTLLKAIAKIYELDDGEHFLMPGQNLVYLEQDKNYPLDISTADLLESFGAKPHEGRAILDKLGIDPESTLNNASGGQKRRFALAESLVRNPTILLLDEPTNHLDLPSIQWLEEYLARFRGAVVMISHDRRFLENTSNTTWWIDRGTLHVNKKGFKEFDAWSSILMEEEERRLEKLNTRLRLETDWLHYGVTARRKRNQGRLQRLHELRDERRDVMQNKTRSIDVNPVNLPRGSKIIIEAKEIEKSYGDRMVVQPFSCRILHQDKIGIIGPNGAGKSTLVKMLVGELQPDAGNVKQGTTLKVTYIDQMRSELNPTDTLWETLCPEGGDQVWVGNETKHVVGYLKEFLFNEAQIRGQVSILSGGEKNRLLLAKAMASPGNLLVLDEPTNDLDMDTLDLLVECLQAYLGTLIVVSHDRDFLDRTVTSTYVVSGTGEVSEYVGGYSDIQQYLKAAPKVVAKAKPKDDSAKSAPAKRLTYNLQREWDELPKKIKVFEKRIAELEALLDDSTLYEKNPLQFKALSEELQQNQEAVDTAETRWLELEMLADEMKG
ncbi:MAG: ABC-F family ATP-binding cassette domain-containing protein [Alphaproteobacteria bacterium]